MCIEFDYRKLGINIIRFSAAWKPTTLRSMETDSSLRHQPLAPRRPGGPTLSTLSGGALPFLLGNVLLGTIGIFVHQAHADPLTATWFRCAFGLLGLTLWLRMRGQIHRLRLSLADFLGVIAASVLMLLGWTLFFDAIARTGAGVAVVLFHVQPLWVLLIGSIWLKQAVSRTRLLGVLAAMLGLVFATGIGEQLPGGGNAAGLSSDYWLGVGACLLGSLATAGVTLIAKRMSAMAAGVLAWWQCAIGTVVLWIWPAQQGWPALGPAWFWLAGLGLLHTGLAYSLLYAGMARLDTGRIAALQFVYAATAILLDWMVLDRPLSALQLAGIALMAAAIWFGERANRAAA